MKMIHGIKQLQVERQRLETAAKLLEGKLADEWSELKTSMKPVNLVRDVVRSFSIKKEKNQDKLKNILVTAAGFTMDLLESSLINKMGKGITSIISKNSK